jgi:hypothetical protein
MFVDKPYSNLEIAIKFKQDNLKRYNANIEAEYQL